jgi:hypothetical protein
VSGFCLGAGFLSGLYDKFLEFFFAEFRVAVWHRPEHGDQFDQNLGCNDCFGIYTGVNW